MSSFEDVLEQFREAVTGPAEEVPLARAALIAARAEYPDIDVDAYERRLQDIAETLEQHLGRSGVREHPRRTILTVNQLLYRELGFRGNTDHYDDSRNLYLNYVLSERRGIPVTMSIVYTEVCQRVGLDVQPVGLPGHVVCRYRPDGVEVDADDLLLDVFSFGRLMTRRDCQILVRNIFGSRVEFKDHYLASLQPRQVLQRLLHNLKAGYLQRGDEDRAAKVIDLLLALYPWDLDEIRDRGMLRERLGDVAPALSDLEQYVQFRPGARDIQTVAETVKSLRRHVQGEAPEG
ncbi:MAG: transglutaminase-like domain-containing protein [Dehalococcoidia bacterium]|nr:transglutaminase-like domain-containing protein [Dehalococcoidia bacterium]